MLVRQAKNKILALFLSIFFFSLLAAPVFAASSTYLTEATKYFKKECKTKAKGDEAAICYLFEKSKEQDQKVAALEEKVAGLEATIALLVPKNIVFASNRPQPFDSEWIPVMGYQAIKINLSITGSITQYDVHYTNDPDIAGYTIQTTVVCNSSVCPEKSLPIIGGYYRISTGTANGNVTALGTLLP